MPVSPMKWSTFDYAGIDIYNAQWNAKRKSENEDFDGEISVNSAKRLCMLNDVNSTKITSHYHKTADAMDSVADETGEKMVTFFLHSPSDLAGDMETFASRNMLPNSESCDTEAEDYEILSAASGHGGFNLSCTAVTGVDDSQDDPRTMESHESHCFGQELSPNSYKVRCYCRPSWENMNESLSFASDIY